MSFSPKGLQDRIKIRTHTGGKVDWEFRGGNREFIGARENEVIVSGPASTGKTIAACWKQYVLCLRRPGANCAIVRKTHASLAGTVLRSFEKVGKKRGYIVLGGESPSKFSFVNGSNIWTYGLDNPERILSSEFDNIYVNQAEELTENDWEMLLTRVTGRAGNVQWPQLMGDCNPSGTRHWIRTRKSLRLVESRHKDNPMLYREDGRMTSEGKKQMERLANALTGVRRKRLLEGLWASVEGAVYDTFDAAIHVRNRPAAEFKRWYMCQDEGYTNPAVILLVGEDGDGRLHVMKEFYQRQVLQGTVVRLAKQWFDEWHCEMDAVDAAAAGLIADLQAAGVNAVGGKGRVIDGIQAVQDRLKVQGDGFPRLSFDPSCINCISEFEEYSWAPDKPKDTPIKVNDHAADATRYLIDVLVAPSGTFSSPSDFGPKVTVNDDSVYGNEGWPEPEGWGQ